MPFPFNVCNHPACHYPGPLQLAFFGTTSQMRWSEMLPALHTANACSVSLGVMQVHAFCRIKTRQASGIVWCVDDQNMFMWFACMFWRVGALSVSHLVSFRGIMMNEDSMNYHVHHPCYADLPSPPPYPKDVRTEILVVFMESVPIRSKLQSCLGVKNAKTIFGGHGLGRMQIRKWNWMRKFWSAKRPDWSLKKTVSLSFHFDQASPCWFFQTLHGQRTPSTEATTVFRRSPLDPIQWPQGLISTGKILNLEQ